MKAVELDERLAEGHAVVSLLQLLNHWDWRAADPAAFRTAVQLGPDNALLQASLVYGLGRAGRMREAREALQQLTDNNEYVPCWFLSLAWIGLDEKEQALESLEDAFAAREPCLVSLKVDPVFDPLRDDVRFADMIRRVGLEP